MLDPPDRRKKGCDDIRFLQNNMTPDRATFHDLRLDYGIYPAVATPETSNVVNIPQKEAELRARDTCFEGSDSCSLHNIDLMPPGSIGLPSTSLMPPGSLGLPSTTLMPPGSLVTSSVAPVHMMNLAADCLWCLFGYLITVVV
ncbi:hypothetical protein Taro_011454 [Colocasia esculenta]|uniref:Uncharacterized protein n=1 Tax=Colocasia esculenta TaxID=4460 RepID=A0A843U9Z7_COLES|nr:hypothetical protein [Colocasia esculenta]